jgi:hypothetical protein
VRVSKRSQIAFSRVAWLLPRKACCRSAFTLVCR